MKTCLKLVVDRLSWTIRYNTEMTVYSLEDPNPPWSPPSSLSSSPPFLVFPPSTLSTPYHCYLQSPTNNLYLSSTIALNGHINYVLLTNSTLAQPLTLFEGDGSINIDTSNVIGASSHAPLLLSNDPGLNSVYKQVVLGDQKSGNYTKAFRIDGLRGGPGLSMESFAGFMACTAAKGVKQVYWFTRGEQGDGGGWVPVVCEEIGFRRVWDLNETVTGDT
ncbi:hypothetical protein BJX76DRAFT_337494 [Aspergillus varians]